MATTYTEIPSTSDSNYWQMKQTDEGDRTTVFVPKDKTLHKELKTKAWAAIQARLPRLRRGQIV